jgi:citronellol/citronellal dehydrogenase
MKRYDMSHAAGVRASFMLSKYCLPHLLKAKNAHILNISPPLTFNRLWLRAMPYGIQKWGMSMCVLGMAEEFREQRIAVNALWPRTTIATSVVVNLSANSNVLSGSLSTTLMADAAYTIVTSNSAKTTGNFFIDD